MQYLKPPYMRYDPKNVSSIFVNRGYFAEKVHSLGPGHDQDDQGYLQDR